MWRGWTAAATAEDYQRHYESEVSGHLRSVNGFRGARYAHLAPPIDRDHGRSGALPRAPGTIVGVQLGEAVTVAQDRPVVATITDRRRNATVRAMHAERRITRGSVSASPPVRPCAYASVLCARPDGLASLIAECSGACMYD